MRLNDYELWERKNTAHDIMAFVFAADNSCPKDDFIKAMRHLTETHCAFGFHQANTQPLYKNICRAVAFKNIEAVQGFSEVLPDILTKKTWFPIPKWATGLPVYPSKEHRAQDTFRHYVEMATQYTPLKTKAPTKMEKLFAAKEILTMPARILKSVDMAKESYLSRHQS